MTDIGELVIRIKADVGQLERELKKANQITQQSAGGMKAAFANLLKQVKDLAPALSVAGVYAFGKSAFQAADRINDLALRTGFAGSTLSSLNIKLLQGGSSLEDFSGSMNRMNNLVGEAAKGINQEAIKAFDDLGLSVKKLTQLSPEEQFYEIAGALGEVKNQATFTNAGMAIFGRSFSNIAPLIKESNGKLREFVQTQKDLGNALTDEELKRIDEFGDAWTSALEHAKLGAVDFLDALLQISKWVKEQPSPSGALLRARVGLPPTNEEYGPPMPKGSASEQFPGTIVSMTPFGPPAPKAPSAKGSNVGLLKDPEAEKIQKALEALRDYNTELQHQHEFADLAPRDAAAMKVYYDTLELAQKAGVKNAYEVANANAEVARSNYDMQKAMEETARFSAELKDQFSQMATDVIFNSKSMSDALGGLAQAMAKMIIQKQIMGPLTDALFGSPAGGKGMLDFGSLFGGGEGSRPSPNFVGPMPKGFATGGSPPVGVPSIVGERGPEIFVPNSSGTVIPNHKLGGSSVTVQNVFQISPGVEGTVRAELMRSLPAFIEASKNATFSAIKRGGSESRLVKA